MALLRNSVLGNPMDRGAWWATVRVVAVSDMTEQQQVIKLSFFKALTFTCCVTGSLVE